MKRVLIVEDRQDTLKLLETLVLRVDPEKRNCKNTFCVLKLKKAYKFHKIKIK